MNQYDMMMTSSQCLTDCGQIITTTTTATTCYKRNNNNNRHDNSNDDNPMVGQSNIY